MDNLKKELGELKKVFDAKKKQGVTTSQPPTKPETKVTPPKKPPFTKPEPETEEDEDKPSGTAPPEEKEAPQPKTNSFPAKKKEDGNGGEKDPRSSVRTQPGDNRRRFGG